MSILNPQEVLTAKLIRRNSFWSFNLNNTTPIPDDVLIEKTLIYIDIEDINLLFSIYPYKKIKQVWLERIAIQGKFFARLNRLLAWMYFDIKNPDRYLKTIENRHLKIYQ